MATPEHWKNRIVGTAEVAPDQLLANPLNFRRHPTRQRKAMEKLLDTVGWVDDIIVNRATDTVVDGHLRVEIALARDEPTVPIKYVDLTPDEERLVLATFDPISAIAFVDRAIETDLLDSLISHQDVLDLIRNPPVIETAPASTTDLGFLDSFGPGAMNKPTADMAGSDVAAAPLPGNAIDQRNVFAVNLTADQRSIVAAALKRAQATDPTMTAAEALVVVCEAYR